MTIVRGIIVVNVHAALVDSILDINRCFACVLRKFRKNAGLSQEKLALEADLDRTFISLLERGLRQPSLKTLFAISEVLNIRPHEIVRAVENETATLSNTRSSSG